ncbi:MAG: DUF4258 domain-containing protein [Cyanobacteria bacterium]|nr:DUF4258 domain-containing protein [Cyanobacteriota bacterium]MDA1021595.1 DUF4258 domain-containing protein [Cyanobacteriota bacterium]
MSLDETELPEAMFEVEAYLSCRVRMTKEQWWKIQTKHVKLIGKIDKLVECIKKPEIIRKSIYIDNSFLCYIKEGQYWLVVIFKKLNGIGFVKTAYITDKIKEGKEIWRK